MQDIEVQILKNLGVVEEIMLETSTYDLLKETKEDNVEENLEAPTLDIPDKKPSKKK